MIANIRDTQCFEDQTRAKTECHRSSYHLVYRILDALTALDEFKLWLSTSSFSGSMPCTSYFREPISKVSKWLLGRNRRESHYGVYERLLSGISPGQALRLVYRLLLCRWRAAGVPAGPLWLSLPPRLEFKTRTTSVPAQPAPGPGPRRTGLARAREPARAVWSRPAPVRASSPDRIDFPAACGWGKHAAWLGTSVLPRVRDRADGFLCIP
jgi:hypothetical protein